MRRPSPFPLSPFPLPVPGFALLLILALTGCLMHEPDGLVLECTPPEIVQVTPGPGETDVPLDADITITFGGPLDSVTVNGETILVIQGADTVPGEVTYSPDDSTVTFDPVDSLLPREDYTVVVTTEIFDTLGIPLDTTFTWTFTTVDTIPDPPDGIADVFPKDGDQDVPLDEEITLTFDTLYNPAVFDSSSIILILDGDTVPGTVTYDPLDSSLVFDPEDSLIPETTYTVILTIPTGDPPGALGPPPDTTISWTFHTVDSIPKAPVLEAINNGSTHSISGNPQYPNLDLFWFPAAGPTATTYRLQISTSPVFATIQLDYPGIPNNSFIVRKPVPHSSLPPAHYYWRVSASNSGGMSPWSAVWNFTVAP
jgi:hypothetical protein